MPDSPRSPDRRPLVALPASHEMVRELPRMRTNQAYSDAVAQAGGIPLLVPPVPDEAAALAVLAAVDALVLTGGEDVDPALYGRPRRPETEPPDHDRDRSERFLLLAARELGRPVLAICRGMQLTNAVLGGTLVQHLPVERPDALLHREQGPRRELVHAADVEPGSRLHEAIGVERLQVNSLHHQGIDDVAPGLRITARAEDGAVEALESTDPDWWLVGVQWHPEELTWRPEPFHRRLFEALFAIANERGRVAAT